MADSKKCSKCNEVKPYRDFGRDPTKKIGYSSQCKICKQESIDRWNLANLDFRKSQARKRYAENRVALLKEKEQYYINNKNEIIAKVVARSKIRKKKDVEFRLRENLRTRTRNAIRKCQKSGSAIKDLGCSIAELLNHLESKFYMNLKTGEIMHWYNYGVRGWQIDHIKPLSLFNLSNREEFLKAAHFSNLQPMWAKENYSKGNKYGGA